MSENRVAFGVLAAIFFLLAAFTFPGIFPIGPDRTPTEVTVSFGFTGLALWVLGWTFGGRR